MSYSPSGGGTMSGAMTAIETRTVSGSSVASITFSSIAASYKHLAIILQARATGGNAWQAVRVQFNGDTAANYELVAWDTTGSGTGTGRTDIDAGYISGGSTTGGYAGIAEYIIPNYASTTFFKNLATLGSLQGGLNRTTLNSGTWKSTAAITSVTLSLDGNNFDIGSTVTLYGLN